MREVFGEIAFFEYINARLRETVGIVHERFVSVELAAFLECARPCGNCCKGIGGDGFPVAPSAVVVDDGPVRSLGGIGQCPDVDEVWKALVAVQGERL